LIWIELILTVQFSYKYAPPTPYLLVSMHIFYWLSLLGIFVILQFLLKVLLNVIQLLLKGSLNRKCALILWQKNTFTHKMEPLNRQIIRFKTTTQWRVVGLDSLCWVTSLTYWVHCEDFWCHSTQVYTNIVVSVSNTVIKHPNFVF
jgi:hypothetical protein